ncbi:histidine--tRNA ligase [Candidatus Saccharibacteria bacterium]|nr:histidine--tRNA ligase [Candidatus Saccharibacteria bacterium]
MKSINTSKVSGTQELLPEEQAKFNNLKDKIAETYHLYGFQEIETPAIERMEILLAKAGGDTEKQIYKIIKTGDKSAESADQALRFDHTVPLARYVTEYESKLTFPFRVAQIGQNFRGERAQKGRFREFYQCDIDIIGRNELPIAYDAEIIATLLATYKSFNLDTPVLARINNRKITTGLLKFLGLTDKVAEIMNIIDHAEKVTPEQTKASLNELQLNEKTIAKIIAFINLHGERSFVVKELNNLEIDNQTFAEGVNELDQVLYLLESIGLQEQITADMKIVRGLDYYTGTVFEFVLSEHLNIGSVGGGGRYENLTKHFTDKAFPGVGGSIGLSRLFFILNEQKLLNPEIQDLTDYAIIPVSEHEYDEAMSVASKLRDKGHSTTIVFSSKKLGDKMTYASKIAKNGVVIGSEETETKLLKAKNFQTGETTELNIEVVSNPEDFWADQ